MNPVIGKLTPSGTAPSNAADAQALIDKTKAKLTDIDLFEQEKSAYLSETDLADLEKMKKLLMGSISLLEQYIVTGVMGTATPAGGNEDITNAVAKMKVGWNGAIEQASDPAKIYTGIITVENKKDNMLTFKVDDTVASISGKTISGGAMVYTITHTDGTVEKYKVNPTTVKIVFAAQENTKGIKMDFSQLLRSGSNSGVIMFGGSGSNTLIGSQGSDEIYGGNLDDKLYGLGGVDKILGGFGKDFISGSGTIVAGEGIDTVEKGPGFSGSSDAENETQTVLSKISSSSYPILSSEWKASPNAAGELVLTKTTTSPGGSIDFTLPTGYSMANAKADGEDILITMYKLDENHIPSKTAVLRIQGALKPSYATSITVRSNSGKNDPCILDFSQLNTGFSSVTLVKGKGDDVLSAGKTEFDHYGVNINDVGHGTVSPTEASQLLKKLEYTDKDLKGNTVQEHWGDVEKWASDPKVDSSTGEITLTPKSDVATLNLNGYPEGFTKVVQSEDKGDTLLTFFKIDATSGKNQRLVVRIKKSGGNPKSVTVNSGLIPTPAVAFKLVGTGKGGTLIGHKNSTLFQDADPSSIKEV